MGSNAIIRYRTNGGIDIVRTATTIDVEGAVEPLIDALDSKKGVLLSSGYEYPGRYTQWDIGFIDPPIQIETRDKVFEIKALNERGQVLIPVIAHSLDIDAVRNLDVTDNIALKGEIKQSDVRFSEEERSKRYSVFSMIRALVQLFKSDEDSHLGLYGAFAYDLVFQFEDMEQIISRPIDRRDLVLYIPDRIVAVDRRREQAFEYLYEFDVNGVTTTGLPRNGSQSPFCGPSEPQKKRHLAPGGYASLVRVAHEAFRRGDLFEVVPGQSFFESCNNAPSVLFRYLRSKNPAPYGTFMNLGLQEYLVGASPEMYVRTEGRRIETSPISGTIARGEDAITDSEQILKLLSSEKEHAELTMCTDVDRNDKARICIPGSVRVIGRRQIEMYSKVIHTVDHVEGILRDGFDSLDAFLTHAWAVTVTGAPKLWAMRFIEQHEQSYRAWYGGAIGRLGFNGDINTGLTLRTIRIKDGVAEVRTGGTLLIDADPQAEEKETELKASAFLEAIRSTHDANAKYKHEVVANTQTTAPQQSRHVLLVDCEDSFVNTLGDYMRQQNCTVTTIRAIHVNDILTKLSQEAVPDLLFLSPGPGRPSDFRLDDILRVAVNKNIPVFGVCLGLQAIVEYFGGQLDTLPYPMHGKPSIVSVTGGRLFEGIGPKFNAARYHSLYARRETLPSELEITAVSEDDVIMAIEHRRLPIAAVQFHPESILTLQSSTGFKLLANVVRLLDNKSWH